MLGSDSAKKPPRWAAIPRQGTSLSRLVIEAAVPSPQTRALTAGSKHQALASGLRMPGPGVKREKPVMEHVDGAKSVSNGERLVMRTRRGGNTGIKKQDGETEERTKEEEKKNGENNS